MTTPASTPPQFRVEARKEGDPRSYKLLETLDKILFMGPPASDKKARKDYEKSIVLWAHDSLTSLCTY